MSCSAFMSAPSTFLIYQIAHFTTSLNALYLLSSHQFTQHAFITSRFINYTDTGAVEQGCHLEHVHLE